MFERKNETPIPAQCAARYQGLAYDGCHFYLTVHCTRVVLQLSACFQQERRFETCRAYTALCYDSREQCFWAAAEDCLSKLYKLNDCFAEIDCITVLSPCARRDAITGVSFRQCDNSLLVSFATGIMEVPVHHPDQASALIKAKHEWFLGVVSLCPYLLCYCMEGTKGCIRIYSHRGEVLRSLPVPCTCGLESAVFWPCVEDFCHCHFCVLCTRGGCYPYLCDYVLTWSAICDSICHCNYELCHDCHQQEHCGDACCEVLESVALMEAALAHILNAEGEKLQKIIASTDDTHKIMAVNESVNKTLTKAIYLEQLLCCKLENLGDCCETPLPPLPCGGEPHCKP